MKNIDVSFSEMKANENEPTIVKEEEKMPEISVSPVRKLKKRRKLKRRKKGSKSPMKTVKKENQKPRLKLRRRRKELKNS